MRLTINLATRGRPRLAVETIERTLPNIELPDTLLMVSVDGDDEQSVESLTCYALDEPRVKVSIRPREDSLGEKYSRALHLTPADVYLAMVDYAPHVTPGFDRLILEAAALFPDNIGVVYNPLANASFPGINGITHGLAVKMGFIYPPWFPYWFVDHWLDDIARLINRISFAMVEIDTSKRPGTQDLRDLRFWTTLFDALHLRRRRMAQEIIRSAEFEEPTWRKELSLRHFPLIESRSKWVNDCMRENVVGIESGAGRSLPDEARYARVKARGVALMKELIVELEQERRHGGA